MKKFFLNHWLAIIIIIFGTFLRVYELQNLGILFGDSARDILVALDSTEKKTLPLLGIPSSRPQFKQGPVSIWIIMLLDIFFDENIFIFSLFYSLLGIGAMIALYEFCLVFLNKKAGLISLIFIAFSPLAISNSRMIYHVTPIPILTVSLLFFLIRFWRQKKFSSFLVALNLSLLFQFELSLAPFFLMIPYVLWQSKQKITIKKLIELTLGITLGLIPQIIFDLTNNFQQLIKFSGWAVFRFTTFFMPGDRGFSFAKAVDFFESYWKYFGRIASVDNFFMTVVFLLIVIFSFFSLWKAQRNNKSNHKNIVVYKILYAMIVFLTFGYFINGSPSEAYFPPYFVLLPLIIGTSIEIQKIKFFNSIVILSLFWGVINTWQIFKANFFVSTNSTFNYGPSIMEQRNVIKYILNDSNKSFKLSTDHPDGHFSTFLDGYRLLAKEKNSIESDMGRSYFIENMNDNPIIPVPNNNFNINKQKFNTISVYNVK